MGPDRARPGSGRRRRGAVAVLLMVLLLTSGCWDRMQIDDAAYIVALGLDRATSGRLLVTVRVAKSRVLSTGILGGRSDGDEPSVLFVAEAETINKALYVLNAGTTRRMDLRHLRAVVVGEPLAREGLSAVVAELERHPWARGTALMTQAKGRALDVIRLFRSALETNPARAAEGLALQAKYLHMTPPVRMHHFFARLAAAGDDPILPVSAINPGVAAGAAEPLAATGGSALPGEMPRTGGNIIDWAGTAIFRGDRLMGFLTVDETQMLLALRGEMGKAYITFPDPVTAGQSVTMRFHQENLPALESRMIAGRPQVEERLLFEGELLAAPGGTDFAQPRYRQRLEQAAGDFAAAAIRGLLDKLRDWQADPVGYGNLFRRQFATWPEWVAFNWDDRVGDLQVAVKVDMRIRRYGLILGPDREIGVGGG